MIKIIVDTLGGDNSPNAEIEGAVKAINEIKDVELILFGDENVINQKLATMDFDKTRISVVHAPDVITCNDKPTDAIRLKKESSLYKAIELLRTSNDVNAFVSSGSTGAILSAAVLKVGRIPGVKRPSFCPILPNMNGGIVGLCDSGANVDCTPQNLCQNAVMGSLYLEKAYGIKNPRVALVNVGVEEEKGDNLRKTTHPILKKLNSINFVGNMESRDLLEDNYDLVVCDGFAGNVLIKSTEGAFMQLLLMLKKIFTKNLKNKMAALLLKNDIYATKDFLDYRNYSGAVLLGANKTIVKSHGSGNAMSMFKSIETAYKMESKNLRQAIAENIEKANQIIDAELAE